MAITYEHPEIEGYEKAKSVSHSELEAIFQNHIQKPFKYSDDIVDEAGNRQNCRLRTQPYMQIKYVNSKVTHQVFTNQFIRKNTPVVAYTGKAGIFSPGSFYVYGLDFQEDPESPHWLVDAEKEGNIARFIGYGPKDIAEIEQHYEIDPKIRAEIAFANLELDLKNIDDEKRAIPGLNGFSQLVAIRDILPGEMLTYPYTDLMNLNFDPVFFNTRGEMLPSQYFKPKDFIFRFLDEKNLSKRADYPSHVEMEKCFFNPARFPAFSEGTRGINYLFDRERISALMKDNARILVYGRALMMFSSREAYGNFYNNFKRQEVQNFSDLEACFWLRLPKINYGVSIKKTTLRSQLSKYGYVLVPPIKNVHLVFSEESLKPWIDHGFDDLCLNEPTQVFYDEKSCNAFLSRAAENMRTKILEASRCARQDIAKRLGILKDSASGNPPSNQPQDQRSKPEDQTLESKAQTSKSESLDLPDQSKGEVSKGPPAVQWLYPVYKTATGDWLRIPNGRGFEVEARDSRRP